MLGAEQFQRNLKMSLLINSSLSRSMYFFFLYPKSDADNVLNKQSVKKNSATEKKV